MSTGNKSNKRSTNSAKGTKPRAESKAIDRPFEAALWKKATKIAQTFRLVIAPEPGVGYLGRTVEMPYVMADGKTVEKCAAETMEATITAIATMLEMGERPPSSAAEAKRDQQVNIRVTIDEKQRLEEAARQAGFRSVSDYLRTSGLDRAG